MAWAERLPSGRYRGCYRDAHGEKQYTRASTFARKAEAVRAAAALEEKARRSMRANPAAFKQTWGTWVEEWWPTRAIEASTRRVDQGRLDRHLKPQWEDVPIGSITRHAVKSWVAKMKANGTGATTIQRCAHLLSASLVAAMDAEIIDSNPAARLQLAGSAKAQERYLTREEYDELREHLPTAADQLVADFWVGTGLRPGELAGVHWNRVDLKRGVVRIVETFEETENRIKAYPKGKKIRDVPLEPELVEALTEERWRRIDAGEDLRAGCPVEHRVGKCRSALVHMTADGSVLRMSNWSYRAFKPALKSAKIGHARLYDLRHTYASWLLEQGVELDVIRILLGHVSRQTTDIYAHLAKTPDARVLAALAANRSAPRLPHEDVG